jgi:predicted alpha/beta hydrolase family esterase
MSPFRPILIVPGFGNSGREHWQSHWERTMPLARRVDLGGWDRPSRNGWIARLDDAITRAAAPPVVVAHSLGVIALASWALAGGGTSVFAALLVAPPDMARAELPVEVRVFGPPPLERLPFPTTLAASSTDPFCTIARAQALAAAWGARFVDLGDAGHVNAASGHGPWPEGERLLGELR